MNVKCSRWAGLAAIATLGCASGAPQPATLEASIESGEDAATLFAPPPAETNTTVGPDEVDIRPDAGAGAGLPPLGDACEQGDVEPCLCVELGTEGERECQFDAASPLDGFFGECTRCPQPPAEPEPPDSDAPDAGEVVDGGVAMDTGNPNVVPPSSPAAGMGCMANPSMCTALLQCCRADGMCGLGLPGVLCL